MILLRALRSTLALYFEPVAEPLSRVLELERASVPLLLFPAARSQGLVLLLPDAGTSFRDPAPTRLARALCSGGYTVALPEIEDLRENRLAPATEKLLFDIIINLSLNFQLCPQGRIGIVSAGRAALLCLRAAGNPEIADLIAHLCLVQPILGAAEEDRAVRKKNREELPHSVDGQLDLLTARLSCYYRKDLPAENEAIAEIQAAARQEVPCFAAEKSSIYHPSTLGGYYQTLRTFQTFFKSSSRKKADARPALDLEEE